VPDTGTTQTLISSRVAAQANLKIEKTDTVLTNASGKPMGVAGMTYVTFGNNKHTVYSRAIVCPDVSFDVLVSWHDLQNLGIISPDFPNCSAARASSYLDLLFDSYPEVYRHVLPEEPMTTGLVKIFLRHPYLPCRVSTARQVPLRHQAPAREHIQSLLGSKVIIREDGPTEWCSPAFFVPKDDGRVRLVTDYTKLNKYVIRPVHPFPSVNDIVQSIPPGMKCFAKLDALNGYFQLGLDEEASKLTTFLLPEGRFRYLRAPMGLSSSSDEWCRHSDRAIEGFTWTRKIVDDILVWAPDMDTLFDRLKQISERCKKLNIVLSKKKVVIGNEIPFAGLLIGAQGVRPDPARLKALSNFP